jgi:polyhydroxybutyrate depolymerase
MLKNVHAVLFACLFSLTPFSGVLAKDYSHNIEIGGAQREFLVHVPDSVQGRKQLPVVMVFHGGGGDAEGMRRMSGMDGVADRNGFIAVFPQGTSSPLMEKMRTWNAGLCCGYAARKKIDDISFVSQMIDFIVAEYGADPKRFYATGHSNGAQISYRLSCELADKIAAIAPNAGQPEIESCKPSRPVPVLHIHGTKDPCALYDGGERCGGCFAGILGIDSDNDKWPCPAVRDVVRDRAKMNGCGDVTEITLSKGAALCEAFQGCPAQAPVALCTVEGAGHIWPGKYDRGPKICDTSPDRKICQTYRNAVGPQNADIDAGEVMWAFFKDLRLPE